MGMEVMSSLFLASSSYCLLKLFPAVSLPITIAMIDGENFVESQWLQPETGLSRPSKGR